MKQIENKEAEVPDFPFQDFANKWLERIRPHLKESSYRGERLPDLESNPAAFQNM